MSGLPHYNIRILKTKNGAKLAKIGKTGYPVWLDYLAREFGMNKREITAFLIGCKAEELMAYVDKGDDGIVAIGPDGKKYRFDNDYLAQAVAKAEADKPKPQRRAPAKKTTTRKRTTRK